MRIVLIRHGPSACASPRGPIDRAAVERWRDAYDAATITAHHPPPRVLIDLVASADVAVASDLPRSVASASRLWPGRSVEYSPLFREMPLRIPTLGGTRVPFPLWALAIHAQWSFDIVRGRDIPPDERQRVDAAAAWCERSCGERDGDTLVAVVTHGVFRRALAHRLVTMGWRLSGSRRYAPWSAWTLARPS